jgi:hypothetical protein
LLVISIAWLCRIEDIEVEGEVPFWRVLFWFGYGRGGILELDIRDAMMGVWTAVELYGGRWRVKRLT